MTTATLEDALVQVISSLPVIANRYADPSPLGDALGGHFSLTFTARDLRTGESVVLKFLRPRFTGGYAERFQREIEICARLIGKAGIVQLRGGPEELVLNFSHPSSPTPIPMPVRFYVLERGSTNFADYLVRDRSPTLRRRLEVVRDVAKGVSRLHNLGFCHRDLKPDNIFLFQGGVGKLGDLGTCRSLLSDDPALLPDYLQPPGHILYAAPELVFGGWNSRPLYAGADWFSVGSILFEALAGVNLYVAIGLKNDLSQVPSRRRFSIRLSTADR